MLIWLLIALFVSPACGAYYCGEFKTIVESIDNRRDLNRDMAEWKIVLRKTGKNTRMIDGGFRVKKLVVEPEVTYQTELWTGQKFVPFMVDELQKMSLCDDEIKKNFYYPVFEGNMTWTDDCRLYPGQMRFQKGKEFDVDGLIHKVIKKTFYGKFQVTATIFDKKKRLVGGITVIVTIVKRAR